MSPPSGKIEYSSIHHLRKVKVKLLSRVQLLGTPWTAAYQAPAKTGFSRSEYWSGLPLPSPSRRSSSNSPPPPSKLGKYFRAENLPCKVHQMCYSSLPRLPQSPASCPEHGRQVGSLSKIRPDRMKVKGDFRLLCYWRKIGKKSTRKEAVC